MKPGDREALAKSVLPMFVADDRDPPAPRRTGSCVLVRIFRRPFIVTARHVFEKFDRQLYFVGRSGSRLIPLHIEGGSPYQQCALPLPRLRPRRPSPPLPLRRAARVSDAVPVTARGMASLARDHFEASRSSFRPPSSGVAGNRHPSLERRIQMEAIRPVRRVASHPE
jgi:hypothetical protein